MSSLIILGLIFAFLAYRGLGVLRVEGFGFLTNSDWSVVEDENSNIVSQDYGLAAMLIGTIITALIAVVIGVPVAVATALFLNFYAPNFLKGFLVSVVDLMAAFPSILFGLWGLNVLMPSAEYWAKLLHKYFSWIPLFEVNPYFFTRSPFVAGVCALILSHSRNTPGAKPIIDYVDMLRALDTLCDNTPYLQTGDAKNWGFGIPKFANIDWTSI